MGFFDIAKQVFEGYEQGRAVGQVTALLGLKRDDETVAEIMRLISSSSEEQQMDLMEQMLANSCQHAWTGSCRQRAAKVYGLFRRFRG